jgi:hypothetical protein
MSSRIPAGAARVVGLALLSALLWVPGGAQAQVGDTLPAGISLEDRGAHPDYPLKLVFATRQGPYLARIDVVVRDAAGAKVVEAFSPGPWLFVKLPAGDYRVQATRPDGRKASARVSVPGEGQVVAHITWPE